jgi:hypothetical protein
MIVKPSARLWIIPFSFLQCLADVTLTKVCEFHSPHHARHRRSIRALYISGIAVFIALAIQLFLGEDVIAAGDLL